MFRADQYVIWPVPTSANLKCFALIRDQKLTKIS